MPPTPPKHASLPDTRLPVTRRHFLRRSAQAAASVGLVSQLGWPVGCSSSGISTPAWQDLASRLEGWILEPDDLAYGRAGLPDNRAYVATRPQAIAVCRGAADVQACVRFARDHGIPAVARSGGHSYSGYSATSGLLVDLSWMTDIGVDLSANIIQAGGGALLGPIDDLVTSLDLTVPAGRCRGVGLAGLTLGGGFGFSCRSFGLTCDNMLSTDMVTAEGDLIHVSPNENADLYWACQGGGGGNFGINVGFEMQAYPVGTTSVYRLDWDWRDAAIAWQTMQDIASDAGDAFSLRLGVDVVMDSPAPGRNFTIHSIGQYFGTSDELEALLAPVFAVTTPTYQTIQEKTFAGATKFLEEKNDPVPYISKSAYLDEPLSENGIETILDAVERYPEDSWKACFSIFTWGGKVNTVAPDATAFAHRSEAFVVQSIAAWREDSPESAIDHTQDWIEDLFESMDPYFGGGAYQNFIDRSQVDWPMAYYGENFERLVEVKNMYDPDNFFRFEQSIPTHL